MANEEHRRRILSGEWNRWRAANPSAVPDLVGADLGGLDLAGLNLRNGALRGARLQGTNFRGAVLASAQFDNAVFEKTVFDDADCIGNRAHPGRDERLVVCQNDDERRIGAGHQLQRLRHEGRQDGGSQPGERGLGQRGSVGRRSIGRRSSNREFQRQHVRGRPAEECDHGRRDLQRGQPLQHRTPGGQRQGRSVRRRQSLRGQDRQGEVQGGEFPPGKLGQRRNSSRPI